MSAASATSVAPRTATPPAIRTRGITKAYKELAVLRGVDLDVPAGSIVALLGSNGAGKTTWRPRPDGCARRSASRGSSRRWTTC